MLNKTWPFVLFIVLETVIYGAGNVVMKLAYDGITPLWCTALRFGIAFAVLMLVFGKRTVRMVKSSPAKSWLPAGIAMTFCYIFCSLSVNMTSATNAGFFIALPMLFAPFIAFGLLGKRYTKLTALLQVAVVCGLYLLTCGGGSASFGLGELIGLGSSACSALALVLSERSLKDADAMGFTTMQIGVTFAGSLVAALVGEPLPDFQDVPALSWGCTAFLALAGTCLALGLQNVALGKVSSVTASVILCAEPVITAIISAFVLSEALGAVGTVGAVMIVACTVAASMEDKIAAAFANRKRPAVSASVPQIAFPSTTAPFPEGTIPAAVVYQRAA
ncbi:MAG: DMT family transporter [Eggerthellaceae bacterium]|nr:DMT family transporter [Eggerthellaceae bacterium]